MSEEKVVPLMEKDLTKMDLLNQWLRDLVYPGKITDFIQDLEGEGSPDYTRRKFCFYTEEHVYYITAIDKEGGGYLGCIAMTRKERAGESWKRGNDLPDGPFNEKTWNAIMNAIVKYEIVKLSKFRKPNALPDIPEERI